MPQSLLNSYPDSSELTNKAPEPQRPESFPARLWSFLAPSTTRPLPLQRVVAAWVYDYIVCLWLATICLVVLKAIPAANFSLPIPIQALALLLFLGRDAVLEGGSPGKRLLGLELSTLKGCRRLTLGESIKRNFYILAPYFLYQLALLLYGSPAHNPQQAVNRQLLDTIKIAAVYLTTLIGTVELVLLHSKKGRRIADFLCGTIVTKPSNATNEA